MRGRRRHLVTAVALLAVASVAAGCGVPTDETPRALEAEDVPFSLLQPTTSATVTTLPQSVDTSRATLYFVDPQGRLTSIRRDVPAPLTPERAIRTLLEGVPDAENDRLSSAITSDTTLLGMRGPDDGLVTINLSSDLLSVTGNQQILAIAQVVFTATALPSVERVLFEFDGTHREVPTGEGKLTAVPLTRSDYRSLLPDE